MRAWGCSLACISTTRFDSAQPTAAGGWGWDCVAPSVQQVQLLLRDATGDPGCPDQAEGLSLARMEAHCPSEVGQPTGYEVRAAPRIAYPLVRGRSSGADGVRSTS